MKKLNIGFFADGKWSHRALSLFLEDENLNISFICPRYKCSDKFLEKQAFEKKIDFIKHSDVNSVEFINKLSRYKCDLFISMSFNQIFKESILKLPNLGTINCHLVSCLFTGKIF